MADKQSTLAEMRAAGRVGRGVRKLGLLDDADVNIGNKIAVAAFGPTDGSATTSLPSDNPRGNRLLFLDGLSPRGRTVTVALAASSILKAPNINQSNPNIITATIEYGNGAQDTFVEVDVPVGRVSFVKGVLTGVEDGSTLVTVPGGTLRVWARNDSFYIVPDLSGLVGNVANLADLIAPVDGGDADDAFVKAFAVYYSLRSNSIAGGPTRTYCIGNGAITGGAPVGITYANDPARAYLVPPLAKRFRILRWAGTAGGDMPAFTGTVYDADGNGLYNFGTLVDILSPFFELPGIAHSVGITMIMPGVGFSGIVWEIGA